MKLNSKQYAQSLFEVLIESDEDSYNEYIKKFAKILFDNNQTSCLEEIVNHFDRLWNRHYKIVEAEITSAQSIDNELREDLKNYIAKLTKTTEVVIKESKDENILGGVVLKYGDKILDQSMRNKLNNLRAAMVN